MRKTKRNKGWESKSEIGILCKSAWMLATEVEPLAIVSGKRFHPSTVRYVAHKMNKMGLLPNKGALGAYIHDISIGAWGRWKSNPKLIKEAKQYQSVLIKLAKSKL